METQAAEKTVDSTVTVRPHNWMDGGDRVLILRRCNADLKSKNNFQYPESGPVECPDFDPSPKCGGGLHGWPWGMGLGEGADYNIITDKWLVIAAKPDCVVGELEGGEKCKISNGDVIHSGLFAAAWALINSGRHRLIEAMSKDESADNIASGDSSTAASSGDSSTAASSGDSSKAASSGNSSTAASSGNYSTAASSGNYSTAEAIGENTIAAVVGGNGRVKVGHRGAFAIPFWIQSDGSRFLCGKVGEDGIKADTWYEVVDGKISECKD